MKIHYCYAKIANSSHPSPEASSNLASEHSGDSWHSILRDSTISIGCRIPFEQPNTIIAEDQSVARLGEVRFLTSLN
jgi:hypothetical protein